MGNKTSYTYDIYGRCIKVTDPKGNSTAYAYDGNGNCIRQTNAAGTGTIRSQNQLSPAIIGVVLQLIPLCIRKARKVSEAVIGGMDCIAFPVGNSSNPPCFVISKRGNICSFRPYGWNQYLQL